MRWFTPPPTRTAYFWSIRRPGTVLRESRTRAPVPASASAQARVAVATPDIRVTRFSATRSARSIARALPSTSSSTWPRRTDVPSAAATSIENGPASAQTRPRAYAATSMPASTPVAAGDQLAGGDASAAMVATDVTSTPAPTPAGSTPRRTEVLRERLLHDQPYGGDIESGLREPLLQFRQPGRPADLSDLTGRPAPGCGTAPPRAGAGRPPTRWSGGRASPRAGPRSRCASGSRATPAAARPRRRWRPPR